VTTYPVGCKTTEENIFSKIGHIRASLTYMGASKFCLVECVVANPENPPTHHGANDGIAMRVSVSPCLASSTTIGESCRSKTTGPRTLSYRAGIDMTSILKHSGCRRMELAEWFVVAMS
jgi:hypothetical protein